MRRPRSRRLLGLAAVVACCAGCEVELDVNLEVERDGSGTVEVAAALDEAAAAQVPELAEQLEVEDLEATGWTVTHGEEADEGLVVRATKPFDSAEEATSILDELSGEGGPFRDLEVARDPTVLHDTWRFDGTVDLTAGLAGFSDAALREALDGTDVGWTEEEIAAAAGRPLDEALTFRVAVDLPGDVTSNAPTASTGRDAAWAPRFGEQVAVHAVGRRLNVVTLLWLSLAAVALAALAARSVTSLRRRRPVPRYRLAGDDDRR